METTQTLDGLLRYVTDHVTGPFKIPTLKGQYFGRFWIWVRQLTTKLMRILRKYTWTALNWLYS